MCVLLARTGIEPDTQPKLTAYFPRVTNIQQYTTRSREGLNLQGVSPNILSRHARLPFRHDSKRQKASLLAF